MSDAQGEMGRCARIKPVDGFDYLKRHAGIDFLDRHYAVEHAYPIEKALSDLSAVCIRNGGSLA